jgi:mRNA interferase MazF
MGKPVIGEVVVLPFPQTNLQSGKRRPALVVADLVGDDLVLCQITRKPRSDGSSIPLVLADFERGRLAVDSFIRSNRLFTVEQSVILYAAGKIKDAKLQEVKAKIRQLFA